jgi:hypothetical protein
MKPSVTTALLLAALLLPLVAAAQDQQDGGSYEVYPAEPVGPEGGDYDYDVSAEVDASAAVSFSAFETPLATYGDWVSVGGPGPVWRPRVPAGWRPYYYGRWEWSSEGWLWVSDEPFGWATYHYGRWNWDRGHGWLWTPGYQWAPAWVSWRYSGDVVGWAPLAPGLSLYVTDFAFVDFWWTFAPTTRFCGEPIYGVAYAPGYSRRWYDATRPAPPRPGRGDYRPVPGRPAPPAWGGPAPRFVEDRVGRPLRPVRIVPSAAPGADRVRPGEIGVYRPESRLRPGAAGGRRESFAPGARPPIAVPPQGFDRRGQPGGRLPTMERPGRMDPPPRGLAPPARGAERPAPMERPPAFQAPSVRPAPMERAPVYQAPPARPAPMERTPAYQAPPARPAPEPASPAQGRGEERERRGDGGRRDRQR